jgi:hypothetical protein
MSEPAARTAARSSAVTGSSLVHGWVYFVYQVQTREIKERFNL